MLGQVHAEGFERTIEAWLRGLAPRLAPDDAFSRERARQFSAAAGMFDQTGSSATSWSLSSLWNYIEYAMGRARPSSA